MPIWRLQVGWQFDSAFPRDRMVITPHFNDSGPGTDPDQLCVDLANGLQVIRPTIGELRVTAYDAQGTPPVIPQGEHIINPAGVQATTSPRELAVCLSFYSERNVPRRRGRLYLPLWFLRMTGPGLRPALAVNEINQLVTLFTGLGGTDVDWVVFSRLANASYPVTNWYHDNEWDVMRSRGLRGDQRTVGVTTEG